MMDLNNQNLEKLVPILVPIGIFFGTAGLALMSFVAITDVFILKREIESKFEILMYLAPFLLFYAYMMLYGVKNFNYFENKNIKHILMLIIIPTLFGFSIGYKGFLKRSASLQSSTPQ